VKPYFSKELRSLREPIPVSKFAKLCGVNRETIRIIESGSIPSNTLLEKWLLVSGLSLQDRPDILEDLIQQRSSRNKYVSETEELRKILIADTGFDKKAVIREITDLLMEVGKLTEDMRDGQEYRVAQVIKKHL